MTFSYFLRYILVHNTKFKRSEINSASQMRPPCADIHLLHAELSVLRAILCKCGLGDRALGYRVRVACLCVRPASAAVDKVVPPNEGRDEVCRLKPVKRNECCSIGLMVKSSIFPTWPMLAMSRTTWPRSAQPSQITAVEEQQCGSADGT
jgi:hypothetical protein